MLSNMKITNLNPLPSSNGGWVLPVLKTKDSDFSSFGEAYFSTAPYQITKAWVKHSQMTMNIVVPVGTLLLAFLDDRLDSETYSHFYSVVMSRTNYQRLTVPPGIWFGFKGLEKRESLLLNISDVPHNQDEQIRQAVEMIEFDCDFQS